ncbi:MAG: tRNA (5-methylaminomethyl-2-thiouridine)(34)-methyltransferase MnmD [Pseudomonadota bacterium]
MTSDAPQAKLRWEDGDIPVSARFDDPYYSRSDGLAESRYVFLDGNALSARFAAAPDGFRIAELGFGTGLNFLAAWALWRRIGAAGTLHFVSFEQYPMRATDVARALSRWPDLEPYVGELLDAWPIAGTVRFCDAVLAVRTGDARETVPAWDGAADAWFLDGFAPASNPQMWEPALIEAVFRRTHPGGTAATYSAAGHVRRSLQAAGFDVRRRPGFGTKREMLTATRTAQDAIDHDADRAKGAGIP